MITLAADESTRALLYQARELAEVRDGLGNLIGFFVPSDIYTARILAQSHHETDVIRVRLGQYEREQVHTPRQVWQHIQSKTNDPKEKADLQAFIDKKFRDDDDFLGG